METLTDPSAGIIIKSDALGAPATASKTSTFAYLEWLFDKLMHAPSKQDLPALLPSAWLLAQREPSPIGITAVA